MAKQKPQPLPTLDAIMLATGTDKNSDGHGYSKIYDEAFQHLRHEPILLVELGVWEGASLRAWSQYFTNEHAQIIGVDNDLDRLTTPIRDSRVTTLDIPLNNPAGLQVLATAVAMPIDIVIDDASHLLDQQRICFDALWPRIKPGGLYVIEDLHTYFWPRSNPPDAASWLHGMMSYCMGAGTEPRDNHNTVERLTVHPSMVVFQKRL